MQIIHVQKETKIDSIQKAIATIKEKEVLITIGEGTFYEKIKLTIDHVTITGVSPEKTRIVYDDYALKIHADGQEYNTFQTYTFMILANHVRVENLTIENSSGSGKVFGQAVALSMIGDRISLDNVVLKAHQDTLFLGPLPRDLILRYQNFLPQDELIFPKNHRYLITNSKIIGDVDFIFGAGNAYFKNCQIISHNNKGYIAAPATESDDFYGFTFVDCHLKSDAKEANTYLARPWRDYGKVVFIHCLLDHHIHEQGWDKWNDSNRDKTCRFYEYQSQYQPPKNFNRASFGKILTEKELVLYDIKQVFLNK